MTEITQEAYDAVVAENEALKKENEALKGLAQQIVAKEEFVKTQAAAKPKRPKEPVKVGDKEYVFRFAAFYFEGVYYTAEDAAISPELLKKIVATAGQGILVEKA